MASNMTYEKIIKNIENDLIDSVFENADWKNYKKRKAMKVQKKEEAQKKKDEKNAKSGENVKTKKKVCKEENEQTLNKNQLQITEKIFKEWKKIITKSILNFKRKKIDFKNLKMIIVSSHGVKRYNSARANVSSYKDPSEHMILPPTVKNLIKSLFDAFGNGDSSSYVEPTKESDFYDYSCTQTIKNVLFINVCLTTNSLNYENAVCSIRFINEVLQEAKNIGKKLAVVDLRLVQHKHLDEITSHFEVEDPFENMSIMRQKDEVFKIKVFKNIDNEPYHNYYWLCNTKEMEKADKKFIKTLQEIDQDGYEIKKLFMKNGNDWKPRVERKRKLQEFDTLQDCKD